MHYWQISDLCSGVVFSLCTMVDFLPCLKSQMVSIAPKYLPQLLKIHMNEDEKDKKNSHKCRLHKLYQSLDVLIILRWWQTYTYGTGHTSYSQNSAGMLYWLVQRVSMPGSWGPYLQFDSFPIMNKTESEREKKNCSPTR